MSLEPLIEWITSTPVSRFVLTEGWVWPIAETLHFCALVLMVGTVSFFDLRLLGLGKGVAPATLHRSLRWGVMGFAVSILTGALFISGTPDQYFYNSAFHAKAIALALLGANVVFFYSVEARRALTLGPNDDAPPRVKWIAAASLTLLVLIMCFGRMLTFFRPPF
jgi:hypothetical protein